MSQHWDDRDDEGREPWDVRRANTRLCWWLGLSIALNIGMAVLLVALAQRGGQVVMYIIP